MEILKNLFVYWKLDVWANVLEIIGFIVTLVTILVTLRVKSEVAQLKLNYLFKTRLPDHRNKLSEKATALRNHLRTYESSTEEIKELLVAIEAELLSLSEKLEGRELKHVQSLIHFTKVTRYNRFRISPREDSKLVFYLKKYVPSLFDSSYSNAWTIYTEVNGVVDRVGNSLTDRNTSL